MPMMPYYKATIAGQTPGDLIEIRSTETAKLVASGVADTGGKFTAQYPASVGPVSATSRRVLGAAPWLDDLDVAPGDIFTSPNFGGKLLECRISGTTGLVAPTEADRIPFQYYSRMFSSKYLSAVIYQKNGGQHFKTYHTGTYDDPKFDNWILTWPIERIVEIVASTNSAYALFDDGTVRFTSRNTTTTTSGAYWGYQQVKAWPKILKLWAYNYGCVGMGADGNLYVAAERYNTTQREEVRNLIAANPTAVHFCEGADDEDMATLVLADGTIVSADATLQAETAFITDAAMGSVHCGANDIRNWIFVSQDGQRLYVKHRDDIITYTGHIGPDNPGDRVAKVICGYGLVFYQMESGRQGRWWGKAGVSTIKHGAQLGSHIAGKPAEIQLYPNLWGGNADTEPDYLITPKGVVNLTVASGWSSGLTLSLNPNNGEKILLDGNPLVISGDCVFALIDSPTEDLLRHQPVHLESVEVDGSAGSDGEIAGTLTIEGAPAARDLVAISAAKQGSERVVVGHATSAPGDGAYTMALPGFVDPVLVLALDDSGAPWLPGNDIYFGDRVYPTASAHTGLVYEALGNGTTGTLEPTWPLEAGQNVVDGSVTWTAAEHYRGQVHGPVIPGVVDEATTMDPIVWETDVYLWAGLLNIEGVPFYRYRKSTEQSIKIYRPVETPAAISENLYLYEYAHSVVGALNYHVFTSTIDANDHIYRRVDGSALDTYLPLPAPLPGKDFSTGAIALNWTVTVPGWHDGFVQSDVASMVGADGYARGGSPNENTSMYGRFPLLPELPGPRAGRAIKFEWWQLSYNGSDTMAVEIRFLDDADAVVGTPKIGAQYAPDPGLVFELQSLTSNEIPDTATQIEITLVGKREAGTANNCYIDGYWATMVAI